jgi:hypothetical protein
MIFLAEDTDEPSVEGVLLLKPVSPKGLLKTVYPALKRYPTRQSRNKYFVAPHFSYLYTSCKGISAINVPESNLARRIVL